MVAVAWTVAVAWAVAVLRVAVVGSLVEGDVDRAQEDAVAVAEVPASAAAAAAAAAVAAVAAVVAAGVGECYSAAEHTEAAAAEL